MSKTRDWPGGWQMPGPGTDKAGKCPAVARGDWAQVELTDALLMIMRAMLLMMMRAFCAMLLIRQFARCCVRCCL